MKAQGENGNRENNRKFKAKRLRNVVKEHPELYLELFKDYKEILTDADMMLIFGVSRATLYRWRQDMIIPCAKLGRSIYYIKSVIRSILLSKSGYYNEG